MKNIEELIVDYLDGKIGFEELKESLEKTGFGEDRIKEILEMKNLYSSLDKIPAPEPSSNLDRSFYGMLKHAGSVIPQKEKRRFSIAEGIKNIITGITSPKLSYAVSLIAIGILIGRWIIPPGNAQLNQMSDEVRELKQIIMLTMLDQPAASERIKAINYVNSGSDIDNKVVNALMQTLDTDPNVNVRLASLEVLSGFTKNAQVREGLIQSIVNQRSPLVQIALAELMASLHEKKSVESLKKILTEKEINYAVKTKIEECIAKI